MGEFIPKTNPGVGKSEPCLKANPGVLENPGVGKRREEKKQTPGFWRTPGLGTADKANFV